MTDTPSDRSYRALVRVAGLSRIMISMTIGRTASAMATVVLVIFSLQQFDLPAVAGIVTFAGTAPAVLMGPIAGALLDRHGRTRLVIADHLIGAASLALIGFLAAADRLPAWLLVVIAAVGALTRPLSNTGLRTLLPGMVPRPLWERVNALDSNAFVLATLAGPVAGGVILAVVGGPVALYVIAGLLVVAGVVLVGIRDPEPPVRSGRSLLGDAVDGLRYTWRNSTLRGLSAAMLVYYGGFGVLTIAVPVLLLGRFGQGPSAVGLAWAAMAVAGGVAAFMFGSRDSAGRERRWLVRAMAASAAGAAAMLVPAGGLFAVVLALVVVGFMQGPIDIAMFTLRQRRTDPQWFGRAFAVSVALNSAGSPIATALTGLLIERSVEGTLVLAVGAFLAAGLVAMRLVPAQAPVNR